MTHVDVPIQVKHLNIFIISSVNEEKVHENTVNKPSLDKIIMQGCPQCPRVLRNTNKKMVAESISSSIMGRKSDIISQQSTKFPTEAV